METFYTIYKTTNKINGKFYVGTHKTRNLDDSYLGSGKLLKRAIIKYGLENFEREILHVFNNPEDMFAKEAEIVTEDFLSEENTYNLKIGGFGGWDFVNENALNFGGNPKLASVKGNINFKKGNNRYRGKKHTEETKRKISIARKGKPGHSHSEEFKKRIGKILSESQKGKGNSQYGTKWITNGIENRKIKKDEMIPEGWDHGRIIAPVVEWETH